MRLKRQIPSLLLALALLSACGAPGDTVERFAEANPGSGESISIPGYETLSLAAGEKTQTVYLTNPPENAASFVLTLALAGGETLWTGEALQPGEAFTRITLSRALSAGEYGATLRYDCFSTIDNTPLNGAEIQLTLSVH